MGWNGWNKVGTQEMTSRETSLGHLPDPKCPKSGPRGPKSGQNELKIAFWQHKSAGRAYFGMEGLEQGWNTGDDIQTDQFGPFARPKMSQMWPQAAQKWPK